MIDFDYLTPSMSSEHPWSDMTFPRLFYSSGVCRDQAGLEYRLRARARQMLDVMTDGDTQTVICRSENSRTRLGTEYFTYRDDNS